MYSISIKEFQANIYKHLSSVPFVVTRYGQPLFCVVTYNQGLIEQVATFKKEDVKKEVATDQHIQQNDQIEEVKVIDFPKTLEPVNNPIPEVATSEKEKALDEIINKDLSEIPVKCEAKLPNPCSQDSIGKYKFTINMPEGDKVLEKYLCGWHLDKLVRDGIEVEKINE